MIRLGVNIDHVATLRQARRAHEPDTVAAAVLATLGGADGITIHLREDRRHIQDRDVFRLRETVTTRLNLEMAAYDEIVEIALKARPDEVTLVPEKRQELTTEGGLDVVANAASVRGAVERLKGAGVHVSLFIDPDPAQIDASAQFGADAIEFQTASYSEAKGAAVEAELEKLRTATARAVGLGLHVHMGHGLNYWNVQPIVRIAGVEELNIGHSIVSRAVLVGMERAVREMKQVMQEHYPNPRKSG
ncbi:Pyridoxine 5'-phosphate synthase [Gemmata obscuriglobus]|uniref:Pyridoxine 5'-phosphate synthase n=1 Tax=Gemmata obscuriglobus TaxID=114 RepID=A0A2Z3HD82_9BACT|nr:pyridoxine 5'-phosphate synthase [Gemmata obscuriglobus]AWM40925.1 pyridoxine 5'-phosphate synthase [Gemmata obscuriglobus]QEG25770.1 Pyridoxine 5'-phosphate synthase [Gemmata obscuriglobus]VTR99588.1 pyridoxine 5 -phosphate synthase : Pyridoxine 5'-phosphate synthase OS=Synechococcus sp. (strain JA-3-3Ab) GN=pdxJ PE=3 SV=1: PdxJ [Gemmata obscuriglobus UQM 2246]